MQKLVFKWSPLFKGVATLNDCIMAHKMGWDVICEDGQIKEIQKEV